jgi:hypothetical protein
LRADFVIAYPIAEYRDTPDLRWQSGVEPWHSMLCTALPCVEGARRMSGKLERKPGSAAHQATAAAATAPVQAKVGGATLSGQLGGPGGGDDTAGVQHAAAQGVSGAGGALPHLDSIQRAFGRHDVSGIQAHVGGEAATASRAIGAEAYATGSHVAFAGAPSLHTAAHEAAHVVQQRGGVQLKGGVGASGDSHERHADAVADLVVQGRSAEAMLDHHSGGGGAPGVQRKDGDPPATPTPVPADNKALIQKLDAFQPVAFDVTKPAFDVDAMIAWAERFASTISEAKTATGATAAADVVAAIDRCLNTNAPHLQKSAEAIRTAVIQATNDSSVTKKTPAALALPSQAQAKKLGTDAGKLSTLSSDAALPAGATAKAALQTASSTAQDAALATLQSLSVSTARDRWKKGTSTETPSAASAGTGARTELDDIYKDSGFSDRVSTYETEKDGVKTKHVFDWCGMFVVSSYFKGGGLAKQLRGGFWHTDNVQDFFNYAQAHNAGRVPMSIWADSRWWNLKDYHKARGSLRTWTPRATIQTALAGSGADIRPGDTCLIDHSGGNSPGHIVMVESYDAATKQLVTIEGNTFGIHADSTGKAERLDDNNLKKSTQGSGTAAGVHVRDLRQLAPAPGMYVVNNGEAYVRDDADLNKIKMDGAKKVAIPADASVEVTELKDVGTVKYAKVKDYGWTRFSNLSTSGKPPDGGYAPAAGATVWGVGRPSFIDFEDDHEYATNQVPAELQTTSPDQIRELAKKADKAGTQAKGIDIK